MKLFSTETRSLFAAFLLFVTTTSNASAGLVLQLSTDGLNGLSNSVDVQVGLPQRIEVYLTDTDPGGVLETVGLFSFALSADTPTTNFGRISSATINPVFDFETLSSFSDSTIRWESSNLSNPISTGQSILLGDFTFEATNIGSTQFTLADRLPGTGTTVGGWLDGNGLELDQQIFGAGATQTFSAAVNSVTAVPEPSSMILMAGAAFGMIARRRVRRRD